MLCEVFDFWTVSNGMSWKNDDSQNLPTDSTDFFHHPWDHVPKDHQEQTENLAPILKYRNLQLEITNSIRIPWWPLRLMFSTQKKKKNPPAVQRTNKDLQALMGKGNKELSTH